MATPQMPPLPAGFVPASSVPPPPPGFVPQSQAQAPQASQPDPLQGLTSNPNKEGLYRFMDTSTAPKQGSAQEYQAWLQRAPVIYVPYSKALALLGNVQHYKGPQSGEPANDWERFKQHINTQIETASNPMPPVGDVLSRYVIHPDEVEHLFRSYQKDPNFSAMRRGEFLTSIPALEFAKGGTREAAKSAVGLHDITPGLNKPAQGEAKSSLRKFAETPQQNVFQTGGGAAEPVAEFMTGEELVGALARTVGYAPKLAEAAKIEQEINKGTTAGQLFRQALTQGAVGGAQQYVKTGGDAGSAATTGVLTAVGTGVIGGASQLVGAGVEAGQAAAEARAAQAAAGEVPESAFAQAQRARAQAIEQNAQNRENYIQAKAEHAATVKAGEAAHEQQVVAPARAAHTEYEQRVQSENAQQLEQATAAHAATVEAGKAAHGEQVQQATQKATEAAQAERAAETARTEAERAEAAQKYGEAARGAIEPHLRAIEEAGQGRPITMTQPGGGPGVKSGTTASLAKFNTDEVLNRVGDYTGAHEEFRNALNESMDSIDAATGGRFRALNAEVTAAQKRVYVTSGDPEAVTHYKQKLGELDDLIASSNGVKPEFAGAVRSGWRQYYVMGDMASALDKSVMGIPGETGVSQAQRGINGKTGMTELSKLVRTHGRGAVVDALGGEDRLKTLETVFQKMSTNNGRADVNKGILNIAKYLEPVPPYKEPKFVAPEPVKPVPFKAPEYQPPPPPERPARVPVPPQPSKSGKVVTSATKRIVSSATFLGGYKAGMLAGGPATGIAGGTLAAASAEAVMAAGPAALRRVQDALLSNPKIAKNILYAVEYGARPEIYGPFIARLIDQAQSQEGANE